MNETHIRDAEILWDYHSLEHDLVRSDIIIGLGSYDLRVANHCADLLAENWAPFVIFTGAEGNFTLGKWDKSEAEMFADVAVAAGADPKQILVESNATNTGDNIRLTKKLCEEKGITARSAIIVSKPNMNHRALATAQQFWPELKFCCSHPDTHFLKNPAEGHSSEDVIHEIVGDMQRMIEYPALGYQAKQEIPPAVSEAYNNLVEAGFTGHMMS